MNLLADISLELFHTVELAFLLSGLPILIIFGVLFI